jgi:sugar lactone lactonase YvrE
VYVDNGASNHRVDKWTATSTNSSVAIYINGTCFGMFIDSNNTIYCSMGGPHQVVKKPLNSNTTTLSIVAGNGTLGSASNLLNNPRTIVVDSNFNLYVADSGNSRIQFFRPGQLNATTLVGNGTSGTISLYRPTGLVLDADGYLFIADTNNQRIIGSGPNGFRCIIGCSGVAGSNSDQLNNPWSLNFDSYGNIFVVDALNSRIQKFLLATNSCGKYLSISRKRIQSSCYSCF